MLARWLQLARWEDWSTSKLPFLAAAALLLAPATAIRVLAVIGTVISWAAFGYCVNDVADRHDDVRAGKANRAAAVSPVAWSIFLMVTAGGAIALSFLWGATAFVIAGLVLACLYSLPPLRLKERGVIGLATGAAAQWVLPVLAIAHTSAALCMALLALAIGTRWMAIHQLQDLAADRQAGVHTYASDGGRMWPVLLGAFLCEIVLLAIVLLLTWPQSIAAVATLVFWMAQQVFLRPRGETLRQKLEGYDHAPLAEYYFLLLPLSLAMARSLSSPEFLIVAAIVVAVSWCYAAMMFGEWADTWRTA